MGGLAEQYFAFPKEETVGHLAGFEKSYHSQNRTRKRLIDKIKRLNFDQLEGNRSQ